MTKATFTIAATLALAVGALGCNSNTEAQSGGARCRSKWEPSSAAGSVVGLVLRDTQVVDIAPANAAFEAANASAPKLTAPGDMKDLITRYDAEWKAAWPRSPGTSRPQRPPRLCVRARHAQGAAARTSVPDSQCRRQLRRAHRRGSPRSSSGRRRRAGRRRCAAVTAPGIWERKAGDTRDNPYLFQKSPTVVIGATDPIVIPRGRTHIDFECEFNVVIGKTAKYVPVANAADYIFGYTVQIDVSDRGGRGDRKMGGSDWLVGKNHDTFGPLGPFIVPKEFMKDPMNIRHVFTLNDQVMQDSNTNRMSHNIFELLHYASNILTLSPGDVISGGSPAGTNIERAEPRWMRAGDTAKCAIEGIGTQIHPVVAEGATTSTQ